MPRRRGNMLRITGRTRVNRHIHVMQRGDRIDGEGAYPVRAMSAVMRMVMHMPGMGGMLKPVA